MRPGFWWHGTYVLSGEALIQEFAMRDPREFSRADQAEFRAWAMTVDALDRPLMKPLFLPRFNG